MTTKDLTRLAEEHTAQETANDAQKLIARDRAVQEVEDLTSAADTLYQSHGGQNELPWFMQVEV